MLVLNKKIIAVSMMIGKMSLNANFSNCEKLKSCREKDNIISAAINTSHLFFIGLVLCMDNNLPSNLKKRLILIVPFYQYFDFKKK
jgi:hypothetical protein